MGLTVTIAVDETDPDDELPDWEPMLGPWTSVASNDAGAGYLPSYENAFRHYAPLHRAKDGDLVYGFTQEASGAGGGFYYDRGAAFLIRAERETDPGLKAQYLSWALSHIAAYRDFVLGTTVGSNNTPSYWSANAGAQPLWSYPRGLYAAWVHTGDNSYRQAIARLADVMANASYYWDNLHDTMATDPTGSTSPDGIDNREQVRIIQAVFFAYLSGATSTVGMNYEAKLLNGLPRILSSQGADGSWGTKDLGGKTRLFMLGILMDGFIELLDTPGSPWDGADPARATERSNIILAMKKSADWMWENGYCYEGTDNGESAMPNYRHQTAAMRNVVPGNNLTNHSDRPWGGLNGMMCNVYAWLGRYFNDQRYIWRGDYILQGALLATGVISRKEFNENFSYTHKLFVYRSGYAVPGCPNRLLSQVASDLTYVLGPAKGWSGGTVTKPGGVGEDGVTPYSRLTVGPAVRHWFMLASDTGWPSEVIATVRIRAKRPATGGAPSFRCRFRNGSISGSGVSVKFTFTGTETWETFVYTGMLINNLDLGAGSSYIELGGGNADNSSDATITAGDIDIAHIYVGLGDIVPVETPGSFALGVAIPDINVPARVEVTGGTFSVNGHPARSTEGTVVRGDVVTSGTSGAIIKVGRVPGLNTGRTVTVP
jgi:hypothetical protein